MPERELLSVSFLPRSVLSFSNGGSPAILRRFIFLVTHRINGTGDYRCTNFYLKFPAGIFSLEISL